MYAYVLIVFIIYVYIAYLNKYYRVIFINKKKSKKMPNKTNKNQKRRRMTMSNSNYNTKRRMDRKYNVKYSVKKIDVFKHKTSIHRVLSHYIVIDRKIFKCKVLYCIIYHTVKTEIKKEEDDEMETDKVPYIQPIDTPLCVFIEQKEVVPTASTKILFQYMLEQYDASMAEYGRYVSMYKHADYTLAYIYPLDKSRYIHINVCLFDMIELKKEKGIIMYKCATEIDMNDARDNGKYVYYKSVDKLLDVINYNAMRTYYLICRGVQAISDRFIKEKDI